MIDQQTITISFDLLKRDGTKTINCVILTFPRQLLKPYSNNFRHRMRNALQTLIHADPSKQNLTIPIDSIFIKPFGG